MKKFLKLAGIFLLVFVLFLYFLGSCRSRPEVNETSVIFKNYDNPDDYEKALDEYMKTGRMSIGLTAHADFHEDWEVGFNDIKDYASDSWDKLKNLVNKTPFFTNNNGYDEPAVKGKENNPAYVPNGDTYVIPHEYEMYGKRIVEYSGGTSELIEVYLFTSDASTTDSTGYVQVLRKSDIGSTSYSFHIMLNKIATTSTGKEFSGNSFYYYPLGYLSNYGCDETFTKQMVTEPGEVKGKSVCISSFFVENTNSIHVDKYSTTKSISQSSACGGHLTVCSVKSNDYDYVNTVNVHCNNKNKFFPFIFFYGSVNFRAGDIINKFNIDNYVDVGFNYDNTTDNISFNPDIYNNYWDLNIKPELEIEYNKLFNSFPDIDVTFPDSDGNRNNLVVIQQPPDPVTTYPVATGDVNVNVEVDVTFPPEFYDEYPPLDTTPAFIAENPDVDFALDSPLPTRVLEISGGFIYFASDFLNDVGLMPVALFCVSLSFVVMVFL